ncbi:MAG TPA: VanZ family protein [Candidatus Sulfotelmatobacter sp.]|nr:VanZ family protein [Candidatus Sulfotelmatobacter sp.]
MPKLRSFLKSWLPVLVWMAVIFSASGDRASLQHSSRLIGPIVHWLFPQASEATLHEVIVAVRKGAHLTEYAILALLIWGALRNRAEPPPRPWQWSTAASTVLLVMLYAASDEIHQHFVPSREASVVDVLIDTTGGALAMLLLWVGGRVFRRW